MANFITCAESLHNNQYPLVAIYNQIILIVIVDKSSVQNTVKHNLRHLPSTSKMQNSDYKLLVVDDDDRVRHSFIAYLEDSGFVVYGANSARSAIALYDEVTPDLLITDLKMPEQDGLSLLRASKEQYPELPVIVISGASVMSDVIEALRLGAVDYFIKPVVDLEVLEHAVLQGLEKSRLRIENARYRSELEQANTTLKNHITNLEQDQQAGHFVQQSLLPPSPYVTNRLVCRNKVVPSLFLSGDCIDYALLEKRYFSFYLADVSGHGSAPAFVAIWLKNLLSQLVRLKHLLTDLSQINQALNQLLTVTNDQLIHTGLSNNLTMIVGIIDTKTNELFYSVAGHLPLPILISDQGAQYLEGKGMVIGLQEETSWKVYQQTLPNDCSLAMFSDGILEITDGKNLIEKEKNLLDSVEKTEGEFDKICQQFELDSLENAPDDVAVLTINLH